MKLLNALLHLYPAHWRLRYEDEFIALLEQHPISLVDIGDIALGALDARLKPQVASTQPGSERRPFVDRASFIKWSGLAGMCGSVIFFAGMLAMSFISNDEYLFEYDALDTAAGLLFLAGVLLTFIFTSGFALAHARALGVPGQFGLLVGLLGLLSLVIGAVGHLAEVMRGIRTDWWTFYILGLLGTFLGMSIACLAGTLQHALPAIPSRLTLASGFAVVTGLLLSMGLVQGINSETMRTAFIAAFAVCLVLFTAGLFLLGLDLWTRRSLPIQYPEPAALT